MLKLSSDLSEVVVTGHGHTVNSLSAPEQNVVTEATRANRQEPQYSKQQASLVCTPFFPSISGC